MSFRPSRRRVMGALLALLGCVAIAEARQLPARPARPAQIDELIAQGDKLAAGDTQRADLALPLYREAIRLADRAGELARLSRAWMKAANCLWELAQDQEALVALERARTLARGGGDPVVEGLALRLRGVILLDRGQYEEAERALKASQDVARRLGNIEMEARALTNLSANARFQGRLVEAVDYGRLALEKVDAALVAGLPLEPRSFFSVPFNLGKSLSDSGDYASAIVYFDRAFSAAQKFGQVGGLWHALHDTAEWYRGQGDLDRASRYYERALVQSRLDLSGLDEAQTQRGLGLVAQGRGEFATAIERYSTALALFERVGVWGQVSLTLPALARAQFLAGRRDLALASIQRALRLASAQNKPNAAALAHIELARQEQALDRLAAAALSYETSLQIARENGLRPFVPVALAGLAQVAHQSGNLPEAVRLYRASADAIATIRSHIVSIDQRAAFADAEHTTYAGLIEALMELHRRDPKGDFDREALVAVERERTQSLTDALNQASADRSREVPSGLRDRQRQLQRLVAELQIQLQAPDISPSQRKSLLARLDDAERALDAFEGELGRFGGQASPQSPRKADVATHRWAAPSDVAALQRWLDADEAVVEYASAGNREVAFVVTRDGLRPVELPRLEGLADRIEFFIRTLTGPTPADALPAGRALARGIVAPVLAVLPPRAHRLLIAAAGSLAGLPFAALPDPAGTAGARDVPLLNRFEVAYVPSLAALAHLRTIERSPPPRDLLAIGDPRRLGAEQPVVAAQLRGTVLGALPYSRRELAAIARYMPGPTQVLTDAAASEARFKASPLGEFKVLHFATHAVLDPVIPSRSAIVLGGREGGEDGFLQPREIYGLNLSTDLVVLSACRTAAGRASSAEGMQSLARAFLYAGARAVVGTLWDVDDFETAQLTERFYAALAEDVPAATALREAQLATAGSRPYERAASWAGFVLAGDPLAHPAIESASLTVRLRGLEPIWPAAGVLLMLTLAGWAMVRRRQAR